MRILYIPLEPIVERYTGQWSGAKTGWLERNWIQFGVDYVRIEGPAPESRHIKTGAVLDARARSVWAFGQIAELLRMGEAGEIRKDDVILFDDFWHPGMESLRYAFDQWKIRPKMFAFLHAQSVDCYDFTAKMAPWMRPFEQGIAKCLDGIFTSCSYLKDLITGSCEAQIFDGRDSRIKSELDYKASTPPITTNKEKVYVTGHPFSPQEVASRMPFWHHRYKTKSDSQAVREPNVVYSSRLDSEKDPFTMLSIAEAILEHPELTTFTFTICSSSPELRSNDPSVLAAVQSMQIKYPDRFFVYANLSKEQYYGILQSSCFQLNTALQDFVAISLLEASVAGCYPIYPNFRSFPETFNRAENPSDFLYIQGEVWSAMDLIVKTWRRHKRTPGGLWSSEALLAREWIHERFKHTWELQLNIMEVHLDYPGNAITHASNFKSPFNSDLRNHGYVRSC